MPEREIFANYVALLTACDFRFRCYKTQLPATAPLYQRVNVEKTGSFHITELKTYK